MKVLGKQIYRFYGVEVDPWQKCLRRDGEELELRQKSFRALLYLIEQRHRLVGKDELIGHVWEGAAVSDDALVQLVKGIRRSLGDDPRRPRFIKTTPKEGYRFIAPVEEVIFDLPAALEVERHDSLEIEFEEEITGGTRGDEDAETPRRGSSRRAGVRTRRRVLLAAAAAIILLVGSLAAYFNARPRRSSGQLADVTLPQLPGKRTLAVMYFDNQSASPDLDWLREGLADMLVTGFSRSQRLTVLSRGQLHLLLERAGYEPGRRIRLDEALGIARRSRAEVVVLGSFARLDEKVRIEVQLHDTATGRLLASESLTADRPGHILNQIDLLSLKLGTHLGAAPADRAPRRGLADVMTHNLEAYRYYSLALEKAQGLHNTEAIALLERAVALDPQFAMAHARIGYAYAITGDYAEKSKPYFERAFQLSDRLTEKDKLNITAWYAIANLDFARAAETLRIIVADYPFEVEAYLRLGRLLQGEGRYEEAVGVLRQGLTVDPEAKDLYNLLGNVYSVLGRHDEAFATHRRYVELAPGEPNALDSLGMSYQWAGRYDEAIEEYERALALKPEFGVAVIHLGNTYFQLGRYREAVGQYERYVQLAASDYERARGYASLAHVYLKKGDLRRAEPAARRAVSHEKLAVTPLLAVALEQGQTATAARLKARLLEQGPYTHRGAAPSLRPVYYWRGYLNLKSGRPQEALEDFQKALGRQPHRWDMDSFEDGLANAYLELGQLDDAINEYERILRLNPNYPLAHFHLGQAYERKGLTERARASYERFLQVWKDADSDLPELLAARNLLSR